LTVFINPLRDIYCTPIQTESELQVQILMRLQLSSEPVHTPISATYS